MRFIVLLAIVIISCSDLKSQQLIPTFGWQSRLSYYGVHALTQSSNTTYAATSNGLLSYNPTSRELKLLDQTQDLSDVGVAGLVFSQRHNTLVIIYKNANIDLIDQSNIINIRTLKNIAGHDTIYQAVLKGDSVLIATNTGLAVLALKTPKLTDVYENLHSKGEDSPIFKITFSSDSIYNLNKEGINVIPAEGLLLNDFNNWNLIVPHGDKSISQCAIFKNKLIYTRDSGGIYRRSKGEEVVLASLPQRKFKNIYVDSDVVFIVTDLDLVVVDSDFKLSNLSYPAAQPLSVLKRPDQTVWVGDKRGLLELDNQTVKTQVLPNSTLVAEFSRMRQVRENTFLFNKDKTGFSFWGSQKWSNFTSQKPLLPNTSEVLDTDWLGATSSFKSEHFFLITSDRLWELESVKQEIKEMSANFEDFELRDIVLSSQNELWIAANRGSEIAVFTKTANSNFRIINFSQMGKIKKMAIDGYDHKWIATDRGLLFFNNDLQSRLFSTLTGDDPNINAFAIDLDNTVWIAENDGLAALQSEPNLGSNLLNVEPVVPRQNGLPLFNDTKINALEVDAGNRKWIGTVEGLFLFNANLSTLIRHFTTENSPLRSNHILDLALNHKTGEVFVNTDKGLIVLQSDASTPSPNFDRVEIFPNPVPPGYQGTITIANLRANSQIRITDLNGHLVWQGQSYGGRVSWNGTVDGFKIKSGIYLVFAGAEGQNFVGRLAVVW